MSKMKKWLLVALLCVGCGPSVDEMQAEQARATANQEYGMEMLKNKKILHVYKVSGSKLVIVFEGEKTLTIQSVSHHSAGSHLRFNLGGLVKDE